MAWADFLPSLGNALVLLSSDYDTVLVLCRAFGRSDATSYLKEEVV